ncbi:MAG: sigma-70 family RNA polymerase sigma factor [Bacteroidales bacterium]|nr:sigma-70 family RNA polymerase sigma factor [Bacteroidales bacterium]
MQLFADNTHLNSWIAKAKEGDRRAQKAIYDALSGKMYAVCLRYMTDRDSAEDVLQEGFVTLFAKLSTYTGEGSFEGWARKIFVNTALMSLRKNDVLKESTDVDAAWNVPGEAPSAIQQISYKELYKAISELPAGFRTVFNMYVVEGYSHAEIAEYLGISEATSRSQLLRARAMLQTKIKK